MIELAIQKRNWKKDPHWLAFYADNRYFGSVWSGNVKLRYENKRYCLFFTDYPLYLHFDKIFLRIKERRGRE